MANLPPYLDRHLSRDLALDLGWQLVLHDLSDPRGHRLVEAPVVEQLVMRRLRGAELLEQRHGGLLLALFLALLEIGQVIVDRRGDVARVGHMLKVELSAGAARLDKHVAIAKNTL